MKIFESLNPLLSGTLLVAGTTIGVGMLALPVATGPGGFIPALAMYLICWLFMLATGLLLVEVGLSMPKGTSFISMAESVLGPTGKYLFWVAYLFLFVTVMIAHVAGGGSVLSSIPGWPLPSWVSAMVYTAFFAPVVYLGAKSVDRLNQLLITGVVLFYLGFIFVSMGSVQPELLVYSNWGKAAFALPILVAAFTYQVIIPTLISYLNRDARKIRSSIILGSAIPFVIYLIWEFVILGIVPTEGPKGLMAAATEGLNAVAPLRHFVQSDWILTFSNWFAFFALTTSFIPLALSFHDFLADGLKWEKRGLRKLALVFLVFGIPTVIAISKPNVFLTALNYAGGVSCAFLFGLMPPVMAWICRYNKNCPPETRQLKGGKWTLSLLILFAMVILAGGIFQQF